MAAPNVLLWHQMASTAPHLLWPRQALGHYSHGDWILVPQKYPQPAVTRGSTWSDQINLVVTKTYAWVHPGKLISYVWGGAWSRESVWLVENHCCKAKIANAWHMCPCYFLISLWIIFHTGLQVDCTNSKKKFISYLCYQNKKQKKRQISSTISCIKQSGKVHETSPRRVHQN